jgi:hypothetical protein
VHASARVILRHFLVQNAAPRRQPLELAGTERALAAKAVPILHPWARAHHATIVRARERFDQAAMARGRHRLMEDTDGGGDAALPLTRPAYTFPSAQVRLSGAGMAGPGHSTRPASISFKNQC